MITNRPNPFRPKLVRGILCHTEDQLRAVLRPIINRPTIRVTPDIQRRAVEVIINLKNDLGSVCEGRIRLSAQSKNSLKKLNVDPLEENLSIKGPSQIIQIIYPLGPEIWSQLL